MLENPAFLYGSSEGHFNFLHLLLLSSVTQFSSVQSLSHVRLSATPWITARQASCPSPTPRVYSNACPSSQWCHPAISSSVIPFSSCLQSFPESGSFLMSQLFSSGGQSIITSASTTVLPVNIQDWFPVGWTGWIALQFRGFSRTAPAMLKIKMRCKICKIDRCLSSAWTGFLCQSQKSFRDIWMAQTSSNLDFPKSSGLARSLPFPWWRKADFPFLEASFEAGDLQD